MVGTAAGRRVVRLASCAWRRGHIIQIIQFVREGKFPMTLSEIRAIERVRMHYCVSTNPNTFRVREQAGTFEPIGPRKGRRSFCSFLLRVVPCKSERHTQGEKKRVFPFLSCLHLTLSEPSLSPRPPPSPSAAANPCAPTRSRLCTRNARPVSRKISLSIQKWSSSPRARRSRRPCQHGQPAPPAHCFALLFQIR